MIPLKINSKNLIEIMLTTAELSYFETKIGKQYSNWTDDDVIQCSLEAQVFPSDVTLSAEQYSRDSERTADYELENITIVNCKSKPEFTWNIIKASYVKNLLDFLKYKYNYKDAETDDIIPVEAPTIEITYWDFIGMRTIKAYLGQTLSGTLEEHSNYLPSSYNNNDGSWSNTIDTMHPGKTLYWRNFRVAFPER